MHASQVWWQPLSLPLRPARSAAALWGDRHPSPLLLTKGRCHSHCKASPRAGLGGSGKPLLTSPRAGPGGSRKASTPATWPASLETEARENIRCLWRRANATTTTSFPHGGVGWFQLTTANVPHGRVRWSTYSERTGVGHSLGAVVPPTFYGQNPLPHTGTAALAPPWLQPLSFLKQLATLGLAQALPARMPFGPGSTPQPPSSGAPHGLSESRGAASSTPGPSLGGSSQQQSFMQLGSSLAQLDPRVITRQSPTITLPRGRNGMEPLSRAWMSRQPTSSSGPLLTRCRS